MGIKAFFSNKKGYDNLDALSQVDFEKQSASDLDASLAKKPSLYSVIPYIGNNHFVSSAMSTVLALKSFEQ